MSFDTFLTKEEGRRVDVLISIRLADSRWDREIARKISSPSPVEFYADSNRQKMIPGESIGVVNHGSARLHFPRLIQDELTKATIFVYNPNHEWDANLKLSNSEKDGIEVHGLDTIRAKSAAPLTIAIRPQKSVNVTLEYVVDWTPRGR